MRIRPHIFRLYSNKYIHSCKCYKRENVMLLIISLRIHIFINLYCNDYINNIYSHFFIKLYENIINLILIQ